MNVSEIKKARCAQRRWIRRHVPDELPPVGILIGGLVYTGAAKVALSATPQQRRTWRRRVARARHTAHTQRRVIAFAPPPFGEGPAIGLYDREDDYPLITRAPWLRVAVGIAEDVETARKRLPVAP